MKRSRNVQGFRLEGQMGEANKFNAFSREQGNAAKLGRGGDSLCFLPLFSPKNTIYEFHGKGWWNESVAFTRSPFFKYNNQFSKSSLLPVLVPLPDKLLLIPQDPAKMSCPLWGLPGLSQVESMAPMNLRSSLSSKDILACCHLVMCLSPHVN